MLQKLYEIAALLFNFGKDLQQNRDDIKQLQAEVAELSAATQDELRKIREALMHLGYEVQQARTEAEHEREKLELRLEISRLRAKQLPAAEPGNDTPHES